MKKIFKYIYGPIQSRRQGNALGVDVFRKKVCSFDCVYCEVGKTESFAWEKNHFATTEEVAEELREALNQCSDIDVICFEGMGEPTLHRELGDIIDAARQVSNLPISIITNSAHVNQARVVEALLKADILLPSLNSALQTSFDQINRPQSTVDASRVIEGLVDLRTRFAGEMWLEVFIVPGVNDDPANLGALAEAICRIHPDKVQLNTLQRPGTEEWVIPAPREQLEKIAEILGPRTQVIATGSVNLS